MYDDFANVAQRNLEIKKKKKQNIF